jgi:hypothetical protein
MQCANSLESRATGQAQSGLEQIVAVGKNQLALATYPEEKTCQFSRLAFVCWRGFPTAQPKDEGKEIATRLGDFHKGSALWAGIVGGMRIR